MANDIIVHNTETMCIEALWKVFTNSNFRALFIAPYEKQVSLFFTRIKEIFAASPLLAKEVTRFISNPYVIELGNGSMILGFTTGASSSQGAASVRGQRSDALFLDELDYMSENDYATISMIAAERSDITTVVSSTPAGKRGIFWQLCTNPAMGYKEFYYPSTCNPGWDSRLEDQFRAQLTPTEYEHEVLAEFGTEELGVFPKDKVDAAMRVQWYAYDKLNDTQMRTLKNGEPPEIMLYSLDSPAPYNPFRCVGVDWDAYAASSSIIVLDFDLKIRKFKVIKRIEVPRAEYSIDNAVNWVIKVNEIYRPSWIFCDRGYGNYQIERLHIYGDNHPQSGLKNKVVGYQFKQSLEIIDPITRELKKEPMKPFMVNQLVRTFDRDRIILSPFDETLHKQLIDYSVDKISTSGQPVYTSINEHFVDALGLAHLAFVLKFPEIAQAIKIPENTSTMAHVDTSLGIKKADNALVEVARPVINPWKQRQYEQAGKGEGERRGDYQQWVKVPLKAANPVKSYYNTWGTRGRMSSRETRTMW